MDTAVVLLVLAGVAVGVFMFVNGRKHKSDPAPATPVPNIPAAAPTAPMVVSADPALQAALQQAITALHQSQPVPAPAAPAAPAEPASAPVQPPAPFSGPVFSYGGRNFDTAKLDAVLARYGSDRDAMLSRVSKDMLLLNYYLSKFPGSDAEVSKYFALGGGTKYSIAGYAEAQADDLWNTAKIG